MCLACGYYKGRQVMDLAAQKQKREARIKAKQERIRAEAAQGMPEPQQNADDVSTDDTHKEAREEHTHSQNAQKRPE